VTSREGGARVRVVSFILAALAAAVFVLGIVVNLVGGRFVAGLAPITLWRFSVACIGFAIYLHLFARDRK
jgi:hypothetical protein